MNILITSAGQRVSLVRAFKQELSSRYPAAKVFTTDMRPELSAACIVSDKYYKVRRVTDPLYIEELEALCLEAGIKMIVPTIDTELLVLSRQKDRFKALGIDIIISDTAFVEQCRDKRKSSQFFIDHGIDVPLPVDKANPTFPLFIKPFDGGLSVDTFLIRRQEELTEYHFGNEKLLFMEYIDKVDHDEYTVDMYFNKKNEISCIVPRKRLAVRAGEVNKALTCNNLIVPFLRKYMGSIPGAIGCLTVQFFHNKHTNRIIAIEINPRFGGGYPLSYRAGANYPGWLIDEYFNGTQIDYYDAWADGMLMLRYDDEVIIHGHEDR